MNEERIYQVIAEELDIPPSRFRRVSNSLPRVTRSPLLPGIARNEPGSWMRSSSGPLRSGTAICNSCSSEKKK